VTGPAATITIALHPPLAAEDQARGDVYALLGGLFSRPPDGALLRSLGAAPRLARAEGSAWPEAFNRLADARSVMDAAAAEQEYTDMFVGVGHSEVDLHASYWITAGERPLPELRAALARLGLGRRADAALMEDHLGALLETMRLLVAGGPGVLPAPVATQAAFFQRWLDPWPHRCCTAIDVCSIANYYRAVAECTKIFLAIERDSLAIE